MTSTGKQLLALDDDQKFALMKMRRSMNDVLQPQHDDRFLVRWLKARSWNPEAAEKMLRKSFESRIKWEVDTLDKWDPPEPLKLFLPSGTCGYDKDGAPVIVLPFAGFDVVGMLHSVGKQAITKMAAKIIEYNLKLAHETEARQVVAIFDMDNFNLKQYAWRPATELVISLLQMYEANYPEILKVCYVINAPRVFAIAFSLAKRFLNEYTISKIQIYKNDPQKWMKALRENIDADNLPKYYGGNLTDPDGNPKYTTIVKPGGKVPKSYYTKNLNDDPDNGHEFVSTTIKSGEKLTLDFLVAEDGSFLRWEFETDDHDIGFGVTYKDDQGEHDAVTMKRVAAHQLIENGVVQCVWPATYTVTFDNSYSLVRNKKLRYLVYVQQPLENIETEFAPSEDEDTKL